METKIRRSKLRIYWHPRHLAVLLGALGGALAGVAAVITALK